MTPERLEKFKRVLNARQPDLSVLADQVHKPQNLSAILRSCDAYGLAHLHAVWPRRGFQAFRKTAGGSFNWVTTHTYPEIAEAIATLKGQGHKLYAAHFSDRAVDFRSVDYTLPCSVILGAELDGVSQTAADAADEHIVIPMLGMVESLNVSAACAVILAEAQRQRMSAGLYDKQRISQEAYESLLFAWCQPKIKRFCDERNLEYPEFDPETGDLVDGVNWMREVREIRREKIRARRSAQS